MCGAGGTKIILQINFFLPAHMHMLQPQAGRLCTCVTKKARAYIYIYIYIYIYREREREREFCVCVCVCVCVCTKWLGLKINFTLSLSWTEHTTNHDQKKVAETVLRTPVLDMTYIFSPQCYSTYKGPYPTLWRSKPFSSVEDTIYLSALLVLGP